MTDDPKPNPDAPPASDPPPVVTRVELPTARPRAKPRPGFGESLLWCLAFWAVLLVSSVGTIIGVFGYHAAQAADPGKFVDEQLKGFVASARPAKADGPRPPVPAEIGASLAYGMLAAQVGTLLFVLVLIPRFIGKDWKRQLGVRRPAAMHVFLVVLVLPGFIVLSEGIQELFTRLTGLTPSSTEEAIRGTFQQVPLAVALLAVSLGPGLVEELFCRGFLGRGLCARYGIAWGVGLTSVLFAGLHLAPSQALVFALMGAYLHFTYIASRSIWVPVLLHLLNNGTATLIILNPDLVAGWNLFKDDARGLRAVMDIAAFGLLVFVSVALWTSRARVIAGRTDDAAGPTWEPEYPGVSIPPKGAGVKLGYGAVSPAAVVLAMAACAILVYLVTLYKP